MGLRIRQLAKLTIISMKNKIIIFFFYAELIAVHLHVHLVQHIYSRTARNLWKNSLTHVIVSA